MSRVSSSASIIGVRSAASRRGSSDSTTDDIGTLVNGDSFSDLHSGDDSNSWMQRIDVSNFQKLTAEQENSMNNHVKRECKQEEQDSGNMTEDSNKSTTACPIMLDHGGYVSTTKLELIKTEPDHGHNGRGQPQSNGHSLFAQHQLQSFPSPADSQQSHTTNIMDCDYPILAEAGRGIKQQVHMSHQQATQQRSLFIHGNPPQDCIVPTQLNTRIYPKPIYSYSCLIALSLKNSKSGKLTVAEIYNFMCENFPYFRTAPAGWKNSVRHNLSLNKCFEKIEIEAPGGHGRKSCLWALNPNKKNKMDQEIRKWRDKDPEGVREALLYADELELIERGGKGIPCESNPYWNQPTPTYNEYNSQHSQQLLVVRSNSMPVYAKYAAAPTIKPIQQGSSTWPTGNPSKMARLSSQPVMLDQNNLKQEPHPQLYMSSPGAQQHQPYGTPQRSQQQQIGVSVSQSSPFSQTPPYSPNIGDNPQQNIHVVPASTHWSQQSAQQLQHSTPVKYNHTTTNNNTNMANSNIYGYSPYALSKLAGPLPQGGSPSHGLFTAYQPQMPPLDQQYGSPCKLLNTSFGTSMALGMMGPYEATQSALHNNSLLHSPRNHANVPLTLQSL